MLASAFALWQLIAMALPNGSTLRTISTELKAPAEFIRRVLGNMTGLQRDCQVRLLLTSNIRYPDYQVEDFIYDEDDGEERRVPIGAKIVRGRNHKELDYENDTIPTQWSAHAMQYLEVQQLLGELRGAPAA